MNEFNGVPVPELFGKMKFEFEKLMDIEAELAQGQYVCSTFTESMFRRQGLPLLSGMLDNTFDEAAWELFVGNAFVSLQVVSDVDHSKLLFTIPPMMNTGRSLQHYPGQVSLSEETDNIRLQADIISEVGEQQLHQMIASTLTGIEDMSYLENALKAKYVIDLVNWIYARYQVNGKLEYPEGLLNVCALATKAPQDTTAPITTVKQPTAPVSGIGDGDDY